jgi:ribonucleoside-diphosphate reductase alpha chain
MPGLAEEIKKNVNRPVPGLLPMSDDTDVVPVKSDKGNGHSHEHRTLTLTSMITNQQDAPTCPNCGHVAVRNGACYKCLNCGESLGCS